MNFIETIELAQEKINKIEYVSTVFIERKSWDNNTNIIVCVKENGVCFIPKFDNTMCLISLEDLKANDWEVAKIPDQRQRKQFLQSIGGGENGHN